MATLQIKKKSLRTWEHIDSQLGIFILSKFEFSEDGQTFQIVENNGAKRRIYNVTDIEVFDIGGGAETFANITFLSLRLEELKYPAFNLGGVFEFDPSNYDLEEFNNDSDNPFLRQDDATPITAESFGAFASGLTTVDAVAEGDLINFTDISDTDKQKKTTWSNIKTLLGAIFQASLTEVNFGAFTNGLTAKTTPVDADTININDSADSNKQKKVTSLNFYEYLKSKFDLVYSPLRNSPVIWDIANNVTSDNTTSGNVRRHTIYFPANSITKGSMIQFIGEVHKSNPVPNPDVIRLVHSNDNFVANTTNLGILNINGNLYSEFGRKVNFDITTGNMYAWISATSTAVDPSAGSTTAFNTVPFDVTQDNWFAIFFQCNTSNLFTLRNFRTTLFKK